MIRWDRVARISLLVVLAIVVASYVGPAAKYIQAWKLSHQTRSELTQLESEHAKLQQRLRALHDPRNVELEARKIGMARPNEKIYVVKGLDRKLARSTTKSGR